MKVIISGGGTGGHIYPAIAIADALKGLDESTDILFVGAKGRMEMEKVPQAGYSIEGLNISGIQRKLTLKNLLIPFKLLSSLKDAWKIISRFQPDIVVGVGGYASGPIGKVAAMRDIPLVLQEQNSFPGLTNKMLGKHAERIFVAFKGMQRYFEEKKLLLSGNPVRNNLVANALLTKGDEALKYFNLDGDKKVILLFGGSLGSRALNNNVRDSYQWLANHEDIQLIWQTGALYFEEMKETKSAKLPNVRVTKFIDSMDLAYAAADLVICRAGALTVTELCLVAKPALLIPSPNVAEDHQTKNAKALVLEKAAEMLPEEESKMKMFIRAGELLKDQHNLNEMKSNLKRISLPGAADKIANEIMKIVNEGK